MIHKANFLDSISLFKEADKIDRLMIAYVNNMPQKNKKVRQPSNTLEKLKIMMLENKIKNLEQSIEDLPVSMQEEDRSYETPHNETQIKGNPSITINNPNTPVEVEVIE